MFDVAKEKYLLLQYIFKKIKKSRQSFLNSEECLDIGIEPEHCEMLLNRLVEDGNIFILERIYYDKKTKKDYMCLDTDDANCFQIRLGDNEEGIKAKIQKHNRAKTTNSVADKILFVDKSTGELYFNGQKIILRNRLKDDPKYIKTIKIIIECADSNGEISFQTIIDQMDGRYKVKINSKHISNYIDDFFRRAKIGNQPLVNKLPKSEKKIIDNSRNRLVIINNVGIK